MLSIATVHVKKKMIKKDEKKQKKNEVEYMRSWFEDLVDFVLGLLFMLNF